MWVRMSVTSQVETLPSVAYGLPAEDFSPMSFSITPAIRLGDNPLTQRG